MPEDNESPWSGLSRGIKDRFTNPIIVSLLISLSVWNWKLTLILFFGEIDRAYYTEKEFLPTATLEHNLIYPAIAGIVVYLLMFGVKFIAVEMDRWFSNVVSRRNFRNAKNQKELDDLDDTIPGVLLGVINQLQALHKSLTPIASNFKAVENYFTNQNGSISFAQFRETSDWKTFILKNVELGQSMDHLNSIVQKYHAVAKRGTKREVYLEHLRDLPISKFRHIRPLRSRKSQE